MTKQQNSRRRTSLSMRTARRLMHLGATIPLLQVSTCAGDNVTLAVIDGTANFLGAQFAQGVQSILFNVLQF